MRILHVTRQFWPTRGGLESFVLALCRQLTARGHQSDVATLAFDWATGRPLPSRDAYAGIQIYRLPAFGPRRYLLAPGVLGLVRAYDLVHVHGTDAFLDLLAATRPWHRRPLVLTTHGGFFHTRWGWRLKQLYFATLTRLALRACAAVACVSAPDYARFARLAPERCLLVPNGVELGPLLAQPKCVEAGLLVTVGRISRNKRLDRLIATLAHLPADVRLAVLGPDWEGLAAGLAAQAQRLGVADRLALLGPCDDATVRAWLARAQLYVSASAYEGFGLAVVEAMGSATVPALSTIAAHRALVRPGHDGFLLDFRRPAEAARQIEALLRLPPAALATVGARARSSARQYDWPAAAARYLAIYAAALDGQPAAVRAA
ncbi:MAG: glycosyltransferase family 4 protein [Chloroflexi bacterium]|nr:glycosyltransferase family 4 protein [Chloroflexota bacterium]